MYAQAGVQNPPTSTLLYTQRNKVKVRILGMCRSQAQKTFGTVYSHFQKLQPQTHLASS